METPRESAHPVTTTVPTAMRQNALQSGGTLSTPTRMETRLPPQRMDTITASRNVRGPIGSFTGAIPVFSRNLPCYLSAAVIGTCALYTGLRSVVSQASKTYSPGFKSISSVTVQFFSPVTVSSRTSAVNNLFADQ